MGLRTRIALVTSTTVVVAAALLGMTVHVRTADDQAQRAAQAADTELLRALDDHAAGVETGLLVNAPELPGPLREAVERGHVRATYLQLDPASGAPHMWAATRVGGDVVAVRQSYTAQLRTLRSLDRVLVGAGALVGALGCLVGIGTAVAIGRRITDSTRTAQRIAEGDLSARITPRGTDEIARLSRAVNTMADALAERLESERRVTADIAHELRTPVAGLVAAVDLLPPGRPTELIQQGVGRLRRTVEDVLEVARLDVPGLEQVFCEEMPLGVIARRAATPWPDVEVRVVRDAVVRTDPRRIERIVTNLITNAHRHGAPPVVLDVDGARLRVRDHGPGFPEHVLADGPVRFRSGSADRGGGMSRGTGLGLTIVAGQAKVLGARVLYENADGGGASVTIDLGAAHRTPHTTDRDPFPPNPA
ncbi:sensor histidine kinase [Streptomyces ficellus]|uniref:histidine kinase n=1 Tax=Streptomyces ficellus TaxID=1977088 RepID=A0A6I6F2K7_9ACTN|nr:HAMP domain-containing sensor histidine kinase [Streptomyces ficellus]QGV77001.1 sensor histidine kinase [Streptomyces ficellus]